MIIFKGLNNLRSDLFHAPTNQKLTKCRLVSKDEIADLFLFNCSLLEISKDTVVEAIQVSQQLLIRI